MNSDSLISEAYREATRPASRDHCPSSEALASMALEGAAPEGVLDHVADCSACAGEVRALRREAPPRIEMRRWSTLAAAAMLVAGFVLGAVAVFLFRQTPEATIATAPQITRRTRHEITPAPAPKTPEINVAVIDLLPSTAVVRGGAAPEPATLPAGTDSFTAILNLDREVDYGDYGLDILDAHENVVWSGKGLRRYPQNTFAVHLSRTLVRDGEYRLVLYGLRDTSRHPIESYRLIVPKG